MVYIDPVAVHSDGLANGCMSGQFSIIFPHHHACVSVTAHYENSTADILDAIWTELVPYL